jgi:hypothetical protein
VQRNGRDRLAAYSSASGLNPVSRSNCHEFNYLSGGLGRRRDGDSVFSWFALSDLKLPLD